MENHDELDLIKADLIGKSEDDGTFEIKVVPKDYDVLIDKPGYLDYIYIRIPVNAGDVIELDNIELIPGDVNKDGLTEIEDVGFLQDYYGVEEGDGVYEERFDFTGDGIAELEDLSLIFDNYGSERTIINY